MGGKKKKTGDFRRNLKLRRKKNIQADCLGCPDYNSSNHAYLLEYNKPQYSIMEHP